MKISKDAARTARRIFRLCSPDGLLNEDHLKQCFEKIIADRPRDFRQILEELYRLVRVDVESRNASIVSATELDTAQRLRTEKNLTEQYGSGLNFKYSTDATLLGGVKIRVGDDVWDGSVLAKLEALTNSF
ncbi:MAG: F0F1 ATP synthase subunit delta [Akkermansiaceae bacterium]